MSRDAKFTVASAVAAAGGLAVYILMSSGAALDGGSQKSGASVAASSRCRLPAVAGPFYPGDAGELRKAVDRFLGDRGPSTPGRLIALIAPHAGYEYSGEAAGKAYALLRNAQVSRVVIIGLSHRGGPQPVWADDVGSYRTPLGDVPVDGAALDILKVGGLPLAAGGALSEHSIEVQLPFLQEALAQGWKLVPILVGDAGDADVRRAAEALNLILDDSTVVCVSTDFTHYGAAFRYVPFTGSDKEIREKLAGLDQEAVKLILAGDAPGFSDYLRRTGATICNHNGVLMLLNVLPEWAKGQQVAYSTSGEKTGAYDMSVSYVSAAFTVEGRNDDFWGTKAKREKAMAGGKALSDAEKKTLLELARATLVAAVTGGKRPDPSKYGLTESLMEKRGAFVTLTIGGHLRGCIGYVLPEKPLYQTVMDNAVNAALEDPRFPSVTAEETKSIRIEISAMSPLETITDVSKIEVGKHGILISRGRFRGLLLPQVATESGWDREEFLRQTCRKANLLSDAWKDPASTIEIFSAEVFHEGE